MVYVAIAETENFQFVGVGTTEEQAKRAVLRKFNELAPTRMRLDKFEDYYGIHVEPMKSGDCVRL